MKTCQAEKRSVAVISPGLLPVPPVIGGSVETVIQQLLIFPVILIRGV